MANLIPGVLLKLFQEMTMEEKETNGYIKPVLLQIISIIPVLLEADHLWPDQGFFLKVADSSHAMYVSLPQELDEMVLCNRLQLGQFIYVERLEVAYPVPMLKGIKPVPGRQPCVGNSKNLIALNNLDRFCGVSDQIKMVVEECIVQKKKTQTKTIIPCHAGRKSWNEEPFSGLGEVSDFIITKHEIKPIGLQVSKLPHSSDKNSSSRSRREDIGLARNQAKGCNQSKISLSIRNSEEFLDPPKRFVPSKDRRWTEADIIWDSLPSNLVKLGKEVLWQRDIALLTAVDILQEASVAERLLKCLSTYSELQSSEEDNEQPALDTFFNLQKDLTQTRLIFQSLTNISPLRKTHSYPNDPGTVREMRKLRFDRKRNAPSWMKAALASDLNPSSSPTKRVTSEANSAEKRSSKIKDTFIVRMQRSNTEFQPELAAQKDNEGGEWMKGSALHTAQDLEMCLDEESTRWFLAYVENYLDKLNIKSVSKQSDSQIVEMMRRIKRVSDWLDVTVNKEREKESSTLKDSELEAAHGRVKNQIYEILLKLVERTALALNI